MHNPHEWIGEAYIAYDEATNSYDPDLGKFSTHFSWVLTGRMHNLINYSGLVHVPVKKRDSIAHSYTGYDDPIGDSNMTVAETIPTVNPEDEDEECVLYRTVLDILADMRSKASNIQVKYWDMLRDSIVSGLPFPVAHKQSISRLNVKLKEKVKKVLDM